jgi:hypothetical protein
LLLRRNLSKSARLQQLVVEYGLAGKPIANKLAHNLLLPWTDIR